ncbi:MAG: radical SAM family heme chaperone HemW [Massilibacteroides sp.]|nr:radical SAM family heme chaperone HemW [Massilibacteroides sp.]
MAGIYIHIPFCAKRCLYCDFFSSTDQQKKVSFLEAACRELVLRKEYLGGEKIKTIYFGGGTPSQLSAEDFGQLFDTITQNYDLSNCEEITLEANPDDLTPGYVSSLRNLPFNRISMGIQSFHPDDLAFLNRRHSRGQAIQAVAICKTNGLQNISIDLMYGLPGQTEEAWLDNLKVAVALDVPHISAYHLIYEEGTPLTRLKKSGTIRPVDEEVSERLFSLLIDRLTAAGYQHYEISNFARPGYLSKHNSSYWNETKYLGIGPSAHSYDGDSRQWNVSSIERYQTGINLRRPEIEKENLDDNTKYNEYIITGLRTMWGIQLKTIAERFGEEKKSFCQQQALKYLSQGSILQQDDSYTLSRKGIFISDRIMSDLLWV